MWHNQYGCIQSVGEKHQVQTLLWSMFDVDFEVQVAENKCCLEYDFELGYWYTFCQRNCDNLSTFNKKPVSASNRTVTKLLS